MSRERTNAGWYRRTAEVFDKRARRCRREARESASLALHLSCQAEYVWDPAERAEIGRCGETHLLQARRWAERAAKMTPIAARLRAMAAELEASPVGHTGPDHSPGSGSSVIPSFANSLADSSYCDQAAAEWL